MLNVKHPIEETVIWKVWNGKEPEIKCSLYGKGPRVEWVGEHVTRFEVGGVRVTRFEMDGAEFGSSPLNRYISDNQIGPNGAMELML